MLSVSNALLADTITCTHTHTTALIHFAPPLSLPPTLSPALSEPPASTQLPQQPPAPSSPDSLAPPRVLGAVELGHVFVPLRHSPLLGPPHTLYLREEAREATR